MRNERFSLLGSLVLSHKSIDWLQVLAGGKVTVLSHMRSSTSKQSMTACDSSIEILICQSTTWRVNSTRKMMLINGNSRSKSKVNQKPLFL